MENDFRSDWSGGKISFKRWNGAGGWVRLSGGEFVPFQSLEPRAALTCVQYQEKDTWFRIFNPSTGNIKYGLNWYKATLANVNAADEATIPPGAVNLTTPVLLMTAAEDLVGLPQLAIQTTQPFAPDLRIESVQSGHFLMLEEPDEVNAILLDWIKDLRPETGAKGSGRKKDWGSEDGAHRPRRED